jgi:predicted RecB family nuclease
MMAKCVCIEYTIKPEADLDDVKKHIADFVGAIASHHPDHRYTSFEYVTDSRRFVHVAELVQDVVPDFQTRPFFRVFSEFLREQCESGPRVSSLDRIASAR